MTNCWRRASNTRARSLYGGVVEYSRSLSLFFFFVTIVSFAVWVVAVGIGAYHSPRDVDLLLSVVLRAKCYDWVVD